MASCSRTATGGRAGGAIEPTARGSPGPGAAGYNALPCRFSVAPLKKIPQLSELLDEDDSSSEETSAARMPSGGSPSGDSLSGEPLPGALPPGETGPAKVTRSTTVGGEPSRSESTASAGSAPRASGAGKVSRSRARRYARERALQALYQWDLASAESSDVRRQFVDRQDMSRVDVEYFERLFRGVSHDVDGVDESLARALDRPIGDLDPIERAILRVAAFELGAVPETPARVVINEGVEITKRFGADNGHRYVNGVLDRLAGLVRPREMRRG